MTRLFRLLLPRAVGQSQMASDSLPPLTLGLIRLSPDQPTPSPRKRAGKGGESKKVLFFSLSPSPYGERV
jgi:hypothetical protein